MKLVLLHFSILALTLLLPIGCSKLNALDPLGSEMGDSLFQTAKMVAPDGDEATVNLSKLTFAYGVITLSQGSKRITQRFEPGSPALKFDTLKGVWNITIKLYDADGNLLETIKKKSVAQRIGGIIIIIPEKPAGKLVLWNKLGSVSEVQNSEVGLNGQVFGNITFAEGKFGNGAVYRGDGDQIDFQDVDGYLSLKEGCFEVWVKPEGWSTTDGCASDGDFKWIWQTWIYDYSSGIEKAGFDFGFGPGDGLRWNIYDGVQYSGFNDAYFVKLNSPGLNLKDGVFSHLAFVWSENGIAGSSDTCRIYLDGILIASTRNHLSVPMIKDTKWRLGNSWVNWASDIGSDDFRGVMDNLKIWNYAKTDFSDRFTE
jgi:hypothetical protein